MPTLTTAPPSAVATGESADQTTPHAAAHPAAGRGVSASSAPGLRLVPAIATDPPYDDGPGLDQLDPMDHPPLDLLVARVRGHLEVDLPELALDAEDGPDAATTRAVEAELRRVFGLRRTPRSDLPDPGPRAAAAVRMLLEVLAGDRPTRQIAGWVSPGVLAGLENRSPRQHRAVPRRPLLQTVRVSEPADGVAEVSAVVVTGDRHRAVALRLDGLDGRWTVTALHVG